MKAAALVAFALLLAAGNAPAAPWKVDHAKSRLGFSVQWSNEPFSAAFHRWDAEVDFDPNDLGHAHATVMVDLASEFSDEPDFDSGLKGAQGFETSRFPAARFETTRFLRKSGNSYLAEGTLTIRGVTRPISLPFMLSLTAKTAHMTGTAHVSRTDFGLGKGEWAAPSPIAHDVAITVDLVATQ